MKKRIIALGVAFSMIFVQGCTNVSKEDDKQREFIIGEIITEAGEFAEAGHSMYYGSRIAIDEINEAGGVSLGNHEYKLKLKVVDDESSPDVAVSAYNTLIDKGAEAIIAPVSSKSCKAIEKQADEDNMLMVIPSATSDTVGQLDNSFRICFSNQQRGYEAADYAFYHMNSRKCAIIYSNENQEVIDSFINEFSKNGGNIVAREQFIPEPDSIINAVNSINASAPDVVFIPDEIGIGQSILDYMESIKMTVGIITDNNYKTLNLTNYASIGEVTYISPVTNEFEILNNKYFEKYNLEANYYAAEGYDAVYAVVEALKEAGNTDSDLQICAMSSIMFNGATGNNISFKESGECKKDCEFSRLR